MTKSAIVLVIGFFLATLDDIDNIFRYVHSADYYLFSKNGLVLFYFTSGALLFILNAASVYFLLMPKIHGYYIAFSESNLTMNRQRKDLFTELQFINANHALNQWYDMEIVGDGGHIQVYVDGMLKLDHVDSNPILEGTISFETLDDSQAQIDDIEILPVD